MGNNAAYREFQHTIITIYNHGKLDLALLDELARVYAGTDIDAGGDTGRLSKDGKDLRAICIETVDPGWVPVKDEDETYSDPEHWEWDERYWKWEEVQGRWGW